MQHLNNTIRHCHLYINFMLACLTHKLLINNTLCSCTLKTQGQEPTLTSYSPNSVYDEVLAKSLVPSHSCFSLYDPEQACGSHTNESESIPSHEAQGTFMLDVIPVATLTIFGLGDRLRVHWLAYLDARLNNKYIESAGRANQKMTAKNKSKYQFADPIPA